MIFAYILSSYVSWRKSWRSNEEACPTYSQRPFQISRIEWERIVSSTLMKIEQKTELFVRWVFGLDESMLLRIFSSLGILEETSKNRTVMICSWSNLEDSGCVTVEDNALEKDFVNPRCNFLRLVFYVGLIVYRVMRANDARPDRLRKLLVTLVTCRVDRFAFTCRRKSELRSAVAKLDTAYLRRQVLTPTSKRHRDWQPSGYVWLKVRLGYLPALFHSAFRREVEN